MAVFSATVISVSSEPLTNAKTSFATNSAVSDSTSDTPTTAIMYTIVPAQPLFTGRRLRRRFLRGGSASGTGTRRVCSLL